MEAGIGSDGTRLYVHVVCSKEVGGWRLEGNRIGCGMILRRFEARARAPRPVPSGVFSCGLLSTFSPSLDPSLV